MLVETCDYFSSPST